MSSPTPRASPSTRRRPRPMSTRSPNCSTCSSPCRPSAASPDRPDNSPNAFRAIGAMTPNGSGSCCGDWASRPSWPDETPNTAVASERIAGSSSAPSPGCTRLADSGAAWIDCPNSKKPSSDSAARSCVWASWPHKVHLFRTLLINLGTGLGIFSNGSHCCGCIKSPRSEEHTSEHQSLRHLVCRLLLEKKKNKKFYKTETTTHERKEHVYCNLHTNKHIRPTHNTYGKSK